MDPINIPNVCFSASLNSDDEDYKEKAEWKQQRWVLTKTWNCFSNIFRVYGHRYYTNSTIWNYLNFNSFI